jgi:hypothetical protein
MAVEIQVSKGEIAYDMNFWLSTKTISFKATITTSNRLLTMDAEVSKSETISAATAMAMIATSPAVASTEPSPTISKMMTLVATAVAIAL